VTTDDLIMPMAGVVQVGGNPRVADASETTTSRLVPSHRRKRLSTATASATLAWAITASAVIVGSAMRAWDLFHLPTSSDEAIVGLMASQILHGHVSAFYWGQAYGGVEPYVVAGRLAIFGNSTFLLSLPSTLLSAASGIVTWRIARRLVADPALAALAAAAAWVAPQSVPYNTSLEYGFRGVTLFAGLILLLLALRVLDGDRRMPVFVGLGLAAGLGWWSSPEIVYFMVPSTLVIVGAIVSDREADRARRWLRDMVAAVLAAVLGALPWLWVNLKSGFISLNSASFSVPAGAPHYVGRLGLFFHYSLPILFSLRGPSGSWLTARLVAIALLAGLLIILSISLVLCFLGDWRHRAIALDVVLFPFLMVVSPATWFWADGRYVGYVAPLIAMVFMVGCAEATRRWGSGPATESEGGPGPGPSRILLGGLVALLLFLSAANFSAFVSPLKGFFTGWGNPNGPTVRALPKLEAAGVRYGYADYWTAYRLDYLSAGKLRLTVAGNDPDRWETLNREVMGATSTAWVFLVPTPTAQNQFSGTAALGPGGLTESQFIAELRRQSIHFRVVASAFFRAVLPDQPVSPVQVGVP
jgi:hypothetical protein